ncbi:pyridoxal phosphate-dependent aminotransferase [Desulfotomaculum defluvii]
MTKFDQLIDRKGTYSLKWDGLKERYGLTDPDLLPFWVADMDFKSPDCVTDALIKRATHGIFGYTGGYQDRYYAALQRWYDKRHDFLTKVDWFVASDTIVASLNRIVRNFTQPGEKVIVQPPVYPPFYDAVTNSNRELILNPLIKQDKQYMMDYEGLEKSIDKKTKLLILCSPHNPVGRVWSKEELQRLVNICVHNGVLIISDEAHSDIVYNGHKHTIFAKLSELAQENCIVCTSPHKTFNLAGLQVSNLIISNPELREKYKIALQKDGINKPNIFATVGVISAYEQGADWLVLLLRQLEDNLNFLQEYLKLHLPEIKFNRPEGTYLAWLDFSNYNFPPEELKRILFYKGKIILNPGVHFGKGYENFFRLNYACPLPLLKEGLLRLTNAFKK